MDVGEMAISTITGQKDGHLKKRVLVHFFFLHNTITASLKVSKSRKYVRHGTPEIFPSSRNLLIYRTGKGTKTIFHGIH